ncbi:LVIVD repeat-containing protein [Streptosporangium lutulentum]
MRRGSRARGSAGRRHLDGRDGLGDPSPSGSPEGSEEVIKSANVTHVANVPPQAPLDGPQAWGTDLAFQGDHAFVGNFDGFSVFDISDPAKPTAVSRVLCPGEQNDISVSGNLLFLSLDAARVGPECDSAEQRGTGWEGIRIFDITDKAHPTFVSAVRTECGSHTHTVVPGKNPDTVYLYVSSPGPEQSATCPAPHNNISVVEVPVKDPSAAKVVSQPKLSGQSGQEEIASGCHDITVYPEKDLAAAACFGDGFLLDISDRVKPTVLQRVSDEENFSIWHSATFNNSATKVVFGDELGGGGARPATPTPRRPRGRTPCTTSPRTARSSCAAISRSPGSRTPRRTASRTTVR